MPHIEGGFKGVRDASIYHQAWLPDAEPKAVVLIVHGLGEHSGRYMNVVDAVVPRGYAVYALDHIGHGKSDGGREIVERFEDYTDTLTTYLALVKGRQAAKKVS
jgi:acylglycerol lipase